MIIKKEDTNSGVGQLDTIAKRIKHVRGRISQEEFAQALGTHRNTIARYEKGLGNPTAEFMKAMCLHYDLRSDWLLLGKGSIKEDLSNKEIRKDIAERLKKTIGSQNSMKFAMNHGIDPLAMVGYLKGLMSPNAENLLRIYKASGVDLYWLITGRKLKEASKLDPLLLADIIEKSEDALNRHNRKLPPSTRAQIFTALYELYVGSDREIDEATIERLLANQGEEKK